ncbi:hypothetical protein LV779_35530 [Streptomyces thinghirensis]|nr:hypothetical protein [Streptomyces thinghirensis]
MKITRIETFAVPPRWPLCRVETDEGIVGWGEPVVEGRAATVRTGGARTGRTAGRPGPLAHRGPLAGHDEVVPSTGAVRCSPAPWRDSTRPCGTSRARGSASPCTCCSVARCATVCALSSWGAATSPPR